MISHFNTLDTVILIFLGIFGVIGLVRGFTRLALMLFSWSTAGFITLHGLPYVKPHIQPYISNPILADLTSAFSIFLGGLIVFSLISGFISKTIKQSALGGLDRSLGMIFGIALGSTLLVIAFIFSVLVWKHPQERPQLIQSSRSLPLLIKGTDLLNKILPKDLLSEETFAALRGKVHTQISPEQLLDHLSRPKALNPNTQNNQGYNESQLKEMERLFQEHGEKKSSD